MTASIRTRFWLLILVTTLTGCGYHLVGQGGSLPEATSTILVHADTALGQRAISNLLEKLGNDAEHRFVRDGKPNKPASSLTIRNMEETLRTQGFDSSGIANQYRLELHGELLLLPADGGEATWRSGTITVHGLIYANGGPAEIEANRSRVRSELLSQWADRASRRLRSGF